MKRKNRRLRRSIFNKIKSEKKTEDLELKAKPEINKNSKAIVEKLQTNEAVHERLYTKKKKLETPEPKKQSKPVNYDHLNEMYEESKKKGDKIKAVQSKYEVVTKKKSINEESNNLYKQMLERRLAESGLSNEEFTSEEVLQVMIKANLVRESNTEDIRIANQLIKSLAVDDKITKANLLSLFFHLFSVDKSKVLPETSTSLECLLEEGELKLTSELLKKIKDEYLQLILNFNSISRKKIKTTEDKVSKKHLNVSKISEKYFVNHQRRVMAHFSIDMDKPLDYVEFSIYRSKLQNEELTKKKEEEDKVDPNCTFAPSINKSDHTKPRENRIAEMYAAGVETIKSKKNLSTDEQIFLENENAFTFKPKIHEV